MKPTVPRRRPGQSVYVLKTFLALIIASIVTAVAMLAGTSVVDKQGQSTVTLTGIVSDTMCGSEHETNTWGDAECTRLCVKMGAEYALGVGKSTYVLQGHQAELDRFAGERVIVKGRMVRRDTIAVESVISWLVSASRAGMDAPAEEASNARQGVSVHLFRN
jgi:hypothetical protein